MDIDVYSQQELQTVFRVLRTALCPTGALQSRERLFLETYAGITGYALSSIDPRVIHPQDVRIEGAHQRKRLVQLSALAVLLSTPVKRGSVVFLKELSQQLATRDSVIEVLEALQSGRHVKVRLLAMRRAFRALLKEAYTAEGLMGLLRFVGALFFKVPVNKDKVWNYKRLGLLPEGTLGREYWKHLTAVGFGFPGEPGGIADSVAYHDIGHVLAGHDTTPLGEIQQGSFQGGNRREDGFFFIQFVILQFHHAIKITPVAPPQVGNYGTGQAAR
jgi:ubiquinone biosynthesis protein Coq4